jgi:hypothetical protein
MDIYKGFSLEIPSSASFWDYYLTRDGEIIAFVSTQRGIEIERANGNIYKAKTLQAAIDAMLEGEQIKQVA